MGLVMELCVLLWNCGSCLENVAPVRKICVLTIDYGSNGSMMS